jgi:RimJ/RimL family protein N-acetyltransferase
LLILETPRLLVRQLEPHDFDEFYAICGDAELMRYVGNNQPMSLEKAQKWLDKCLHHYLTPGYSCSAVIFKSDSHFAGIGGLAPSPDNADEIELIYILKQTYWGQGLATELAQALLNYGFGQLGLKRIIATIDPENTLSIRVAEKLGMKHERAGVDEFGLPTMFYAIEI